MGVVTKTLVCCTCDICREDCYHGDGVISIKVNNGDGRDVGPAFIRGTLQFDQPYVAYNGVVCLECKKKYLKRYLQEIGGL